MHYLAEQKGQVVTLKHGAWQRSAGWICAGLPLSGIFAVLAFCGSPASTAANSLEIMIDGQPEENNQ